MLRDVAVVVGDQVSPFELGVLCEVFGIDRTAQGFPGYDFAVCSAGGRPVAAKGGFAVSVAHGLDRLATADLVAVAAMPWQGVEPAVYDALRAAHARGARILSVCSGALILAAAGLLDGRRCTTHWMYADELAAMAPTALVDPDVLYVDDGDLLTSAGTSAGIDLCLHVVRQEHGTRIARMLARRMVAPPHRDGGQAQYVEAPLRATPAETLEPALGWALARLDTEFGVAEWARAAHMSARTFARRFRDETGTTPHHWLTGQRLLLAQRMLEDTDRPVDEVAAATGFGSAATLRHHVGRWLATTPQAYRTTFRAGTERVGTERVGTERAARTA